MYLGRDLSELNMTPIPDWAMEELSYHHYMMSQMSPFMNEQGVSLHRDVIKEIERRGGLAHLDKTHSIHDI
ncbi:hypothetical protein [Hazenella coriacea]|uniref:Cytosolic protein n=1 Tax=Hazenella coriacea TaxID=1179467 RepID=A0A4R3L0F6_9BACL|nr:hypothetical protein [Hazenella coriacea]TCS92804.1 hypothetical protein EDD58_11030 [Hazenella coriacea]